MLRFALCLCLVFSQRDVAAKSNNYCRSSVATSSRPWKLCCPATCPPLMATPSSMNRHRCTVHRRRIRRPRFHSSPPSHHSCHPAFLMRPPSADIRSCSTSSSSTPNGFWPLRTPAPDSCPALFSRRTPAPTDRPMAMRTTTIRPSIVVAAEANPRND